VTLIGAEYLGITPPWLRIVAIDESGARRAPGLNWFSHGILRSRAINKTGRKLVLHQRDDLLRKARTDWAASSGLRQDYMTHRPNVEHAVAQVATWRGRRLKLRYRGVTRNHAWLKRRTTALNLRNLIGKGLARRDGAWALTT
jgi:hypothetical protein